MKARIVSLTEVAASGRFDARYHVHTADEMAEALRADRLAKVVALREAADRLESEASTFAGKNKAELWEPFQSLSEPYQPHRCQTQIMD